MKLPRPLSLLLSYIILLSDLGYEISKIFIWLFSPNLINEVLKLELQQLKGMWQGILKR